MHSKRSRLTLERLRELVDEYNINFEGPVPPDRWPSEYSHIFRVIRDIWANRYDEYKKRTDINQGTVCSQRKLVEELCSKAGKLRTDVNMDEKTWKDSVETLVFDRFDQEVMCFYCRNENWISEYEAEPLNKEEKVELQTARQRRRLCTCTDGENSSRRLDEDSDDEIQTKIFNTAVGEVVSHDPQNNLEDSRIPMKTDRVIALSMNDRYRGYIETSCVELSHSPTKGGQLMYPFLIHKSNYGGKTPGFNYVETCAAFPIRQLLEAQYELQIASKSKLDPLVWFFASQGEEYRLHAAILGDEKLITVFDLWHGNLESQDGSLQILQIVDFLWTWARDVYRPQIRNCLRTLDTLEDEIRPTPLDILSCSQPVLLVPNARSFSRKPLNAVLEDQQAISVRQSLLLDLSSEDGAMTRRVASDSEPLLLGATSEDSAALQEVLSDSQPTFFNASSHLFLQWAGSRDTTSLAALTSMRHSDVVLFSFRVIEIPGNAKRFHDLVHSLGDGIEDSRVILHALKVIGQDSCTLPMQRGQIHHLERYWTDINTENTYEGNIATQPEQSVRALLLFRTFCQPEDWQLKRELYCIIWSRQAMSLLSNFLGVNADPSFERDSQQPIQHAELIRAFQQLRNLSGKQSVVYALKNTNFILLPADKSSGRRHQLRWFPPQGQNIPDRVIIKFVLWFDFASSSETFGQSHYHQRSRLLWFIPGQHTAGTPEDFVTIPDNYGSEGAMLVLKPRGWPQQCPQFCAFVLHRGSQSTARLGHLLDYTIEMGDIYCAYEEDNQTPEALSSADTQLLKSWKDSLSQPAMPRD